MIPQENQEQETRKRKRRGEKLGVKVPRKQNFVRKIMRNEKATKESSFLKRRPTLISKARQLQQLCGVSVGLVIQSPDGTLHTWPENGEELKELIMLYKGVDKRRKKESKLLEFLMEKKRKLEKKKEKAVKEKVDQLVAAMSMQLDGLSSSDSFVDYVKLLDKKLADLKEKASVIVGGDNRDLKIMINNGGPSSSSGMIFGDTRSFPDLGVNGNHKVMVNNGGPSSSPGMIFGDTRSLLDVGVNGDHKIIITGGPSSSPGMIFGDTRSFPDVGVNGDHKIMINGGSSSRPGMIFGDTRSFPEVGVNNFLTQHTYGVPNNGNSNIELPLSISVMGNNGGSGNFYSGIGAENNIDAAAPEFDINFSWISGHLGNTMEEIDNDNRLLPNPSNVHVSTLDDVLQNSDWSPWF